MALDIHRSFEKCSFFKSLFGNYLKNSTSLTVNPDVTKLWLANQETVSYWYIHTLISSFPIYINYINNLEWWGDTKTGFGEVMTETTPK